MTSSSFLPQNISPFGLLSAEVVCREVTTKRWPLPSRRQAREADMVLHMVVITKLQLLATAGGHGHGAGQLLAALLGPFILKLPFSRYAPRALGDVVVSCRLFLFRLSQIFFAAAEEGRWGRALRLVHGRLEGGQRVQTPPPDEDSLHELSMVVL